jgi:hypothetical protein
MASRDGSKQARKAIVVMGGALGAVVVAAAMATGSAVTAAPAKADIDALLDPIIQPFITSLSDAFAGFDPTAATDLTSWTDSLLSSLNALDVGAALPAAAAPAAASCSVCDIPLTMREVTEPTVNVAVEGGQSVPMLVDTGSSGLVVPWNEVGQYGLGLLSLGLPSNIGESGYSGGVDYIYLEYNDATVNYGDGVLTTTNTPIDVEILSWPTAFGSPLSFQQFLADDDVSGILGIGNAASDGGPGTSPIEAAGFSGVTVDIPHNEMVIGANSGTPLDTVGGAPITNNTLTEVVKLPDGTTHTGAVYNDVDSGGVYGTIPSSLVGNAGSVPSGTEISVYDGQTLLYSYMTTGTGSTSTAPEVVSGVGAAGNPIDSGVEPFLQEPIYIGYGPDGGTLVFDKPVT